VSQLETDLRHRCSHDRQSPFASLSIGINADSLATWFFEAVAALLLEENIVLDLHVDDQERTHELMRDGKVWGCISTRTQPLQGCRATLLGRVKYGIFATAEFSGKWFSNGLRPEAFELAPMARYNRKDDLNSRMFSLLLEKPPEDPPTFFLPSTEIYGLFVAEGKCYGILPEQQSSKLEASGRIINLSPDHWVDVDLYWHSWTLKSALMERFNRHFIASSQRILGRQATSS
jgi:LysR family transcriptional regulator (chromosome initiation inhibitor)